MSDDPKPLLPYDETEVGRCIPEVQAFKTPDGCTFRVVLLGKREAQGREKPGPRPIVRIERFKGLDALGKETWFREFPETDMVAGLYMACREATDSLTRDCERLQSELHDVKTQLPVLRKKAAKTDALLRALAACYHAVDPNCSANADGTGDWAPASAIAAVQNYVERTRVQPAREALALLIEASERAQVSGEDVPDRQAQPQRPPAVAGPTAKALSRWQASLSPEQAEALGREWLTDKWKWEPGQVCTINTPVGRVQRLVVSSLGGRVSTQFEKIARDPVPDPRDPGTFGHALAQGLISREVTP